MIPFRRDDRGQSVVLIAVSLPLILSLLLLVIDGGRLYVERERIRNAAQLAAEAAVSLAGDAPGRSQPSATQVRDVVKDALDRNLAGETYSYDVTSPFRTDLSQFNVKVRVTKTFRSSINAVSFSIGADAAALLSDPAAAPSGAPTPPGTPTPAPTPSRTPTPTATPLAPVSLRMCVDVYFLSYSSTTTARIYGLTSATRPSVAVQGAQIPTFYYPLFPVSGGMDRDLWAAQAHGSGYFFSYSRSRYFFSYSRSRPSTTTTLSVPGYRGAISLTMPPSSASTQTACTTGTLQP